MEVIILLSTYNGEKYLQEQLNSIFSQTYTNFTILARDDGSNDNSIEILKKNNIEYIKGENVGVIESFNKLLKIAIDREIPYIMFCDQDDIWKKNKIEISLEYIKPYKNIPTLVHSDLEVVDDKLYTISKSFFKYKKINPHLNSINYLLLTNTITGCSMMINLELAKLAYPFSDKIIMHDWYLGLVATIFGKIITINNTTILYRQHPKNVIGIKSKKIKDIDISPYFLQAQELINRFDNKIVKQFLTLQSENLFNKYKIIFKYKFFKHTLLKNIGFLWKIAKY